MSSPQDREFALFALVAEKPVSQRAALLEAVCGGDPVLRQRLEALFAAQVAGRWHLGRAPSCEEIAATEARERAESRQP